MTLALKEPWEKLQSMYPSQPSLKLDDTRVGAT